MKQLKIHCITILLLLVSLISVAQLKLGERTLMDASAPALARTERLSIALGRASYVAKIGGVAFDKVAVPDNLFISDLKLIYNPAMPDGERVIILLNGVKAAARIYDWQLKPIANFAASDKNACFTLFGDLTNQGLAEKIKKGGGHILNYHSAFTNTLLGLRLFQLDLLVIGGELSITLPKEDARFVLGKGEMYPDEYSNAKGYNKMMGELATHNDFHSYVICDANQNIKFGVKSGTFYITGYPYYHFWTPNRTTGAPIHLKSLSDNLSSQPELFRNINPAVWDSGVTTMRYAAFFRYCKTFFPREWNAFLQKTNEISIKPQVKTPTILPN